MEGESRESEAVAPAEEASRVFLRVELDDEYKVFVKECIECGQEFRTNVPKKFFENSNNESTKLLERSGMIEGYENGENRIRADAVRKRIEATVCADTSRHTTEAKPE